MRCSHAHLERCVQLALRERGQGWEVTAGRAGLRQLRDGLEGENERHVARTGTPARGISRAEVLRALERTPPGSSPGPNGMTRSGPVTGAMQEGFTRAMMLAMDEAPQLDFAQLHSSLVARREPPPISLWVSTDGAAAPRPSRLWMGEPRQLPPPSGPAYQQADRLRRQGERQTGPLEAEEPSSAGSGETTSTGLALEGLGGPDYQEPRCRVCGNTEGPFFKCSCRAVRYCSSPCQRADWPVHRSSCSFRGD